MPKFSRSSKEKLKLCHPVLQLLLNEAIKYFDFKIVCSYRNKEEQDLAFKKGTSKLKYPMSKHNRLPAMAVDIAPCVNGKICWDNKDLFYYMAGLVKGIASQMKINITWGGHWVNFFDGAHFELG